MDRLLRGMAALAVTLALGLGAVGCSDASKTGDKMKSGDKMGGKMDGDKGKMEGGKSDKMGGKMEEDKGKMGDKK
jgi:hypothetical protein